MENLGLKEIIEAVNGEVVKAGAKIKYKSVSTDTRTIEENSIFIALRGSNFNGNSFAGEASKKGAKLCIVDEAISDFNDFHIDTTVVKVDDSKQALLELAKYYRSKLDVRIVGITGSTGKTSTKDIVAAVLSSKYKVFKTKGNFNNEIGLPLMIFKLNNEYDIAVLEMGMSNLGEIHRLADVARPDIAIITNIGVSHIEYLKTRENILKAKLEITDFFNDDNTLIINYDNDLLKTVTSLKYNTLKIGVEEDDVDFKAYEMILNEDSVGFKVKDRGQNISSEFNINIPGKHNVLNALLAIACGKKLGLTYEEMAKGIDNLEFTSMRLDIVKGSRFTIIDDSYNASPDSMKAAIDVLCNINGNKRIAVLGTMKELGSEASRLHMEMGQYAKQKNIDLIITIGEYNEDFRRGFGDLHRVTSFERNEDACQYLAKEIGYGDVVLVKASRSMKFETIVNNLKMIIS